MDPILKYTPNDLLGILKKYGIGVGENQNLTQVILGKYLYYIKNGNFKNSFEGRGKIAKQISIDLKKQDLATIPDKDVFSIITNAKVFVDVDNKKPIEDRGPITKAGSIGRGVKYGWDEFSDKVNRGAGAIKRGLDPTQIVPSPSGIYQKIGFVTLAGFLLFIVYKKLIGGKK